MVGMTDSETVVQIGALPSLNTGTKQPRKVFGRQFQPGQSGNPGGRKKNVISQAIADGATKENLEKLRAKIWAMALAGDLQAASMILDRVEGKAIARQETGDPGSFEDLLSRVSVEDAKAITELADRARKAS